MLFVWFFRELYLQVTNLQEEEATNEWIDGWISGWMDERTRGRIDGWTDDGWMMDDRKKSFHLDNRIIDFRPQTKTLTRRVKTLTKRVTLLFN